MLSFAVGKRNNKRAAAATGPPPPVKRRRAARIPPPPLSPTDTHSVSSATASDHSSSSSDEADSSERLNSSARSHTNGTTIPASFTADDNDRVFDPNECRASRFPIFQEADIVNRETSADLSERELERLTFTQWLAWHLTHPSLKVQRRYLFSDEYYCTLLGYLTSGLSRPIEYKAQVGLTEQQLNVLYHAIVHNTYQYMVMEYKEDSGPGLAKYQKGPVLVCFLEPALSKGGRAHRRKPTSSTPTTVGLARRCVPFSQIEQVVEFAHTGHLGGTMHHGQQATWNRLNNEFNGVSRDIVRMYVKKCRQCQQQQVRTYKAALVPIMSKKLYERVVFDLIDFTLKPCCGFRYILHAM